MRELFRDEVTWFVREVDARRVPGARGERCLIYETEGVVRRVWTFPTDWPSLSDDALWQLTETVPSSGRASVRAPADAPADAPEALGTDAITALARTLFAELVSAREDEAEARAPHPGRRTRAEMRTAIQGYARSLRMQGVPPERVLVLLKDAVQSGLAGTRLDESLAEAMLHDGVEWCIDAYFAV